MSDESDNFEAFVQFYEREAVGRPLSLEERLMLERAWVAAQDDDIERHDAPLSALDALVYAKWMAFVCRLSTRQSSRPPDFNALYRRKAELDRKSSNDPRP